MSEAQSDAAGLTAQVVATPKGGGTFFDSPDAQVDLADLQASVAALPQVLGTTDPAGALARGPEGAPETGAVSADGRVALLRVQYPLIEDLSSEDLETLDSLVEQTRDESSLQVEANGELYFSFSEPETGLGELLGIIAAVIILLVAFGSVIAMGLPIGIALFGLAIGVSSMSLITYLIDIPSWAPQVASMVGLGVGIDYALFLVTRHREHLSQGMAVNDSIGRAVATAGQAVVFAGGTVVIAILGLGFAGVPFMTAAGVATSVVVLIMVVASVTLLPALLRIAGHSIDKWSLGRASTTKKTNPGWERWGTHVSKHAWAYAIGVTALLLAMTGPVLWLQLGFPDDGSFPESRTERRAYDLVAEGFGAGINGPLVIAVDLADTNAADVVPALSNAIGADPGVAAVAPAEVSTEAGVATIVAFATTAPQDDATLETVKRLRAEVFPEVFGETNGSAHVGGLTANFADIGERVISRLPLFIGAVIGLSFLLLMIVFRSVLVPLKAALLNLLSIGAAYGVLAVSYTHLTLPTTPYV